MRNMKKIIIFSLISILSIILIAYKGMDNLSENVYVVSESDTKEKQSISQKQDKEDVKDTNKDNKNLKNNKNLKEITVYVSGEVINPGVVTLDVEKRLSDAVNSLGGVTKDADLNRVNLALRLEDEQHYIIPKIGEELCISDNNQGDSQESGKSESNQKVNINTATAKELDELPGIGEVTADKILKYRDESGKFKSIEEIKNVNGIGDKKYEDLRELISVDWFSSHKIYMFNIEPQICYYKYV